MIWKWPNPVRHCISPASHQGFRYCTISEIKVDGRAKDISRSAGIRYSGQDGSSVELRITFWSWPVIITKIILESPGATTLESEGGHFRSARIRLGLEKVRFGDVAAD